MRKRNVQILFRLTEEEAEHLNELVRKSGRSKEAFLREMVRGYQLCEKPDPEFYKMMRELSAIGNRINQLAVKANALGFVKQGSGTNFRLKFAKGICFHAGHRNGGLRDMGCAWQARPPNRLCRKSRKDSQPQIHRSRPAGDGRCNGVRY